MRDRAARVDEDRRPREPGFHQDDREGLVDGWLAHHRGGRVGRRLGGGVEVAQVSHPRGARRRGDRAVAGEHERQVGAAHGAVAEGVIDEERDVLARLLPAEIEEQRPLEAVAPAERRRVGGRRRIEAEPHDAGRAVPDPVELLGQRGLGRRVEDEAPAGLERLADDAEVGERLVVKARDQDGPPGDERHAAERRPEEIRGEAHEVVVTLSAGEVVEELRAPHRLLRPAGLLLRAEPRAPEDALLEPGVPARVAEPHREAADHHARLAARAGREHVLPREVIPRAGRQHLDGAAVGGEVLGEPADERLGAPHHVGAVARHDEREPGPAARRRAPGGARRGRRRARPPEEPPHGRRPITA